MMENGKSITILLVEDNPSDVQLTQVALKRGKLNNTLFVVNDGEQALAFLRKEKEFSQVPRPDMILLDLNLPKISGSEVLKIIKNEKDLRQIPVVILTTSKAEEDVLRAYDHHANCFITKPVDFDQFMKIVYEIESFWLTIVKLPKS